MHMYHNKLVCTITFIMLAIIVAIYFIIITQEPTLRYPREALLQALHLHRNLFTGLLVQLCCMLYIHAGTYSGYPGASLLKARYTHGNLLLSIMQLCCMLFLHTRALLLAIYTHRNQRSYPGAALLSVIHTYRNILSGIIVTLCVRLHITHRNLLSGILL
jgi:hypothetical protein